MMKCYSVLFTYKGEGHFGKVWRAKAEGIVQNIPHLNIVAVKTCKGMLAIENMCNI